MGDSVGQVGLDLVLNKGEFESGLNSITKLATNAGKMLAGAFAVGKLISFGKECVELGSNLAEVQNVVDTVFPTMNKQIDNFARNAAAQFGLSETMTKNFTGTFGAMGKAFGFSEGQAYDMATALTGLAGDVASFYNMSQDEAYTKLKSVFTGETESLKSLGVVMTQSALDSFALANGFGKATKSMSEAEKAALRFKFVQDQLSAAQGDFMRTSDGWANQVRLLALQFDSLKAAIGSGLIAVLSPVVRMLNILIGRILTAMNALKSFFSMLGGTAKLAINPKGVTAGTDAVAKSADKASGALGGAGGAAKKAAKDIKSATTGIDELNILPDQSDSSGGGSGGEGGGGGADFPVESFDTGAMEEGTAKINEHLQGMIDRVNELKNLFMEGFQAGLGNVSLEPLLKAAESIRRSLTDIFTDPEVLGAANRAMESWAYALGQMAGAVVSIGITIATNLVGGIALYLEQNTGRIKEFLISMFDISARAAEIQGNFAQAVANIFSVFGGETAQQVTANLIGIFANAYMGVTELSAKAGVDILDVFTRPFIENQDGIKTALEGILLVFETVTGSIKETVDSFVTKANEVYDESVGPLFESLASGLSDTGAKFLEFWNKNVQPVLEQLGERFSQLMKDHIQPLLDKFLEFIGSVAEYLKAFWEGILKPFIDWIIATILPAILPILQTIVETVITVVGSIADTIGGLIQIITGIIDFLVGVFTGDWDKAWHGIEQIVEGILNAISGFIKTILSVILGVVRAILQSIYAVFSTIFNAIKAFVVTIFNAIKTAITTIITGVRDNISTMLTSIKTIWDKVWNELKTTVINIFTSMWDGIKGVINSILSGVESMANGVINAINGMINALNSISFDIPDWVPEIGGNSFGLNIPTIHNISIPKLANGGFVKANTPQLAVIGDNRHYGEVVAPENKLEELLNRAVSLASNSGLPAEYYERMVAFLSRISEQIEAMDLTVYVDVREIKQRLTDLEGRSGYSLRG